MNPAATSKTLSEIVAEWPRLLLLTVAVFLGTLWWRLSQKEKDAYICTICQEPTGQEVEVGLNKEISCKKCGGKLEPIEGYYDHHPERR
jgi:DNA-directed RNA polymerase subunit RPC12/RpoP